MAEMEKKQEKVCEEGEEDKFVEGMAVLDFDMLCTTVALQTQGGKWRILGSQEDENGVESGAVLRMWEGHVIDFFDDRRLAIESACCPCYRFGKNMRRGGFGPCFIQGTVYLILVVSVLLNIGVFVVTKRHCFLYLGVAFTISIGAYLGFFRGQIKKKFNIRDSDSLWNDCFHHLICPCCTLAQESRTLEMNNVQDGTWHGRGDSICIGSCSEVSKSFFELHPPTAVSTKSPDPCTMQNLTNRGDQV
ncbi:PLAC8 domain-containing protein [Cephalotus follicularis]|uniref:PLAC8 domain-containing protein n=1 Tax=Cephalotus follicularis TaxID=3775 RepID=A0A1Q3BHP7_CEPFO|nr:PLAC8 domain-containing protein [Cephalotus follicularis]